MAAERRAEGARRAVADAFGDLADARSWRRSRSFATAIRQASRYSIGGRPTVRVKRSKNAERDSAAVFASWRHRPRTCELAVHLTYRRRDTRIGQPAQQARRRVLTWRRPQRFDQQHLHEAGEHEVTAWPPFARFLADEAHQYESRSTPRTCTSDGSSDTSNAVSGESKTNQPPSHRTSGRPPRVPWRTSPKHL